ncbi:uncharacterized protein Dwil_GK11525 [Drosophila willistoni]|uniref:Uncharacterized protein n=1 Tax=Drosophila willistoni TaxID=7260 RepID=B4N913_DROWI|nr:uncharacterized protein LOC6647300 [Drosophila willistoni]EDW80518.1 uncharacterized protein Dwil_GK11525 [Drosophila willistoni]
MYKPIVPIDQNLSKYLLTYKSLPTLRVAFGESKSEFYNPPPCKAKGIPICEPEKEEVADVKVISTYFELPRVKKAKLFQCPQSDSIELIEAISEESEIPATLDEELQIDDIQNEVDRMKLKVSQINLLLGLNTPECPSIDPCLDVDTELKKHLISPEILNLQRNNQKLQQQISQLQLCRKASDLSMNNLTESISADRAAAGNLKKRLGELDSLKRTLEHEQALCGQRYRYMEKDKYDGSDLHPLFASANVNIKRVISKLVPTREYEKQKVQEIKKIQYLNEQCRKLFDYMLESFDKLDAKTGVSSRMQSPELPTYLYRNEKTFNVPRNSEESQPEGRTSIEK